MLFMQRWGLFSQAPIGSGFLERFGHLLDGHLVRVVGHRVDLLGTPESFGNVPYTVQPLQG